jgi:hypothetical protein
MQPVRSALRGWLCRCFCKSHDRRHHPSLPSPPGSALAGNSSNRPRYQAVFLILRDRVEGFGLECNREVTIHGIKGGEGDSLK